MGKLSIFFICIGLTACAFQVKTAEQHTQQAQQVDQKVKQKLKLDYVTIEAAHSLAASCYREGVTRGKLEESLRNLKEKGVAPLKSTEDFSQVAPSPACAE